MSSATVEPGNPLALPAEDLEDYTYALAGALPDLAVRSEVAADIRGAIVGVILSDFASSAGPAGGTAGFFAPGLDG